jgi:hypothetical protein
MIDLQSDYQIAPLPEEPLDAKLAAEQALMYARDLTWAIRQKQENQAALERLRQTFLSTINHEKGSTFTIKLPLRSPKVTHSLEKDLTLCTTVAPSTGG